MKMIITALLVLASSTVHASDYSETCLNRYRDAFLELLDTARDFNHGDRSASAFLADFSAIETRIGVRRLGCTFEPAEIKKCVLRYKEKYHTIRNQIDMVAIARGEQTKVKLGFLPEAGLAAIDLSCQ